MQLHLNDALFGTLSQYGYETPWALARITPVDVEAYRRLCRASEVAANEDMPDDDAEYERELAKRGVTEADLRTLESGAWAIVNPGSSLCGPIWLSHCDADGWVRFRWT